LPPDSTYAMDGSEKYLNCGLIWPHGLTPEGVPPVESFTVKFEQAGEYDYIFILHLWMAGTIVVSQ
jgi:hypothetical protein